jgi:hypothetical protein
MFATKATCIRRADSRRGRQLEKSRRLEYEPVRETEYSSQLFSSFQDADLRQTLASQGCCSRGKPAGR